MKTYIVTYDLHRPGQNYPSLFETLESYPTHWHMMLSVWIIETSESAMDVLDKLLPHIDANDKLFVARLQGEAAWYGLSDKGTNWLRQRLSLAAAASGSSPVRGTHNNRHTEKATHENSQRYS